MLTLYLSFFIFILGFYAGFFFMFYIIQKKPHWAVGDIEKLKKLLNL